MEVNVHVQAVHVYRGSYPCHPVQLMGLVLAEMCIFLTRPKSYLWPRNLNLFVYVCVSVCMCPLTMCAHTPYFRVL